MGLRIAGCMRHGDLQIIFELVFPKLIFRIRTVSFKYRLNSHKLDVIGFFKFLSELFEGWEPNPLTARSPVLKKIKVNHFAPVVA